MIKDKFIITVEYDTNNPIVWMQLHHTVGTEIIKTINTIHKKRFVKNTRMEIE